VSLKTVSHFNLVIALIAIPTMVMAQDRPAPEAAPIIELPEPAVETVEEEIIPEVIEPQAEITIEEIGPPVDPVVEEITVISGGATEVMTKWPGRRPVEEGLVILAFDDVSIDETLGFIAQTTGKVVIPVSASSLRAKKITLRNDEPIDRGMALDLLFQAFRLNQVGVIEREDIIIIGPLDSMLSDIGDIPVLGVDEDVMLRQDRGTLVIKVFSVERTEAQVIGDRINEMFPDYGALTVYPESNQLVLLGDVGLCQQIQDLIHQLDRIWRSGKLQTFRLKYADASEIADNIFELFEESSTSTQARAAGGRTNTPRRTATTGGVELRLTVNMQQNSVTVQAEPDVMEEITELIEDEWDLPRPTETSKMYVLEFSDPIKIRNLLQEILGDGTSSGGGGARGGQNQRADVTQAISGVYRFEAYPDKNALLVLSKTEESFAFLDSIVESLDQPTDVGLPKIVELKHASAVALTQELNALLSAPGVTATIDKPDSGLSGEGLGDSATATDSETGGQMSFPWQQGGANADDQSPESSLISKIRLVPIVRQNAIAILSPPAYMQSIVDVIESFDRPTRQVMISATIAAVTLTDDLSLGLRLGSGVTANSDGNSFGFNGEFSGATDNFLGGIFENTGAIFTLGATNVGVALDALNKLTNVRLIQQPRTFTSDNQESIFFNGSEIPIQTESSVTTGGNTVGGFEYRDVGIMLNVRPRITAIGDIDLTINLELSDLINNAGIGGNPIFSSRQVRSQVQLHDGQTVLLGGILKDREQKVKKKFPLLGDIPLIGALFTSIENQTIREELLVFITPVIVNSFEDNIDNYNVDYLERLKELSLPVDEQIQHIKEGDEFLQNRLRNPASDYNQIK
jgi:type II secretory pathway component GspD/PulD (secretin)